MVIRALCSPATSTMLFFLGWYFCR
jgi:hypothetical protein